jgi:HlyD family secretion protein
MDRELDESFRRQRLGRRVTVGGGMALLLVAAFVFLPGWLRPSIGRDRIRIGKVERGPVEAVVEATGVVVPAFEGVLSSPVETRVERILRRPGQKVRAGDPIVALDTSGQRLEVERIEDRLAQKENEERQLQLSLDKSLNDLRGQIERQRLDTEVLEARAGQSRRLRADGLIPEDTLRVAEVEAKKARIVLRQLEESVASTRSSTAAQISGLEIELSTLHKERDEAARQLELATTRADRDGVLTWVVPEVGATVRRGDVVARIADLDSFRVEATVSDVHSSRLAPGLPVRVVLDEETLPGRLARVDPTIENGAVRFFVDLDNAAHSKLRDNLRVDVLVVTGRHAGTLRLPKGAASQEGGAAAVFVVQGDEAVRRDVRFGLSGYEWDEVLEGLAPGDEVILSDMRDYLHLQRVKLDDSK